MCRFVCFSVVAIACSTLISCQSSPTPQPEGPTRAELEQQLSESQQLVDRYEQRYGKLLRNRPTRDFRKLRQELKGKPAAAVVAVLGKPVKVYTLGSSESWEYANIARDPLSGRTVRTLTIWFESGVVDYMSASF